MKRLTALLLCICIFVSFGTACAKKDDHTDTSSDRLIESDVYLVQNGLSKYSVVIPEGSNDKVLVGADEIVGFTYEASGTQLPIISDESLTNGTAGYYISVGETSLFDASGIANEYSELGNDGFKIIKQDNTVFIVGATAKGSYYGCLEFLNYQFGLEFYTETIYDLDQKKSSRLYEYDLTVVPDLPFRSIGAGVFTGSSTLRDRLRVSEMTEDWGLVIHSYHIILPPDIYLAEHSDWYDADVSQICFSNEEMKAEFIKRLEQIILDNPDAKYFMLGQEDNNGFCYCDNCKALLEQYGGHESALMLLFTNSVVKEVNKWLAENYPDRQVQFATFAYGATMYAPCEYDSETDSYQIVAEELRTEPNLSVMVAHFSTNMAYSMTDERSSWRNILRQWSEVSDSLYIWNYCISFYSMMAFYSDYDTIKDNCIAMKEYNAGWVYMQHDNATTAYSSFVELQYYLYAKLMWDTSLDVNELTQNFFAAYFKGAEDIMYDYYLFLRSYWCSYEEMNPSFETWCYMDIMQRKYWPINFLDCCISRLEEAEAELEKIKESDPETYEYVSYNIFREKVCIYVMRLNFYFTSYSAEELKEMIDGYEYVANRDQYLFTGYEQKDVATLVAEWRSRI